MLNAGNFLVFSSVCCLLPPNKFLNPKNSKTFLIMHQFFFPFSRAPYCEHVEVRMLKWRY